MVLILQSGLGWVMGQDGSPMEIAGKTVVFWDRGDWVEYGTEGAADSEVEVYWSSDLSPEQWESMIAGRFG
jgi:hypothetical protein